LIRSLESKLPTTRLHKEIFVATKDINHDADSHRARFPIKAAAVLLGIYIATYLAVAAEVHFLASPDAAAIVAADNSTAPSAAATASSPPVGAGESPLSEWLDRASEWTDTSRECAPSAAIDSKCTFN
jgi:hypothetical protein